jgi:3-mercaptopyruvate sulfurtransferase SseA
VIGLILRGLSAALFLLTVCGCAGFREYHVAETEERHVVNCTYIDTVTAFSDMGPFQVHPILTDDARDRVLRRAEALNATHVVWLGDYYFGGAAMAYYCWD